MLDEGQFRSRWFAIGASFQAHDHVVLDRKQRNAIDVVDLHPRLQCFEGTLYIPIHHSYLVDRESFH